jgi:predicted TIM-barrel fold metal-dependent hydrolase
MREPVAGREAPAGGHASRRPAPARADVTWDAHAHVIGDPSRHPFAPTCGYEPAPAPLARYLAFLDRHGLDRGVLVQPSVYGFDHGCMLEALERSDGRLLGVAVPAPDTDVRELERLHAQGVRGVRCNLINPGGLPPEAVLRWRPALRELGWHVSLHVAIDDLDEPEALVERLQVPVVFDHMGRPGRGHVDPEDPGPRRLLELVRAGACFTKLSAPYRLSAEPAPWRDVAALARAFVAANPAACVWASDWPWVDTDATFAEGDLFRARADWCPDPADERALTVEGACRLLGRATDA